MEARDVDGEVIWTSSSIDITAFPIIEFDIDLSMQGEMEVDDYINVYYTINGGAEQVAVLSSSVADADDNFVDFTHHQVVGTGNNLVIILDFGKV